MDDPATFAHEEILGAYEALKKAGKYRVLGFSTHDPAKICPPAFESKLFGALLVPYNSVQFRSAARSSRGEGARIGVIAMKTLAGREQDNVPQLQGQRGTYAQAAIKWALADPAVTSAVVSARTFEHVTSTCAPPAASSRRRSRRRCRPTASTRAGATAASAATSARRPARAASRWPTCSGNGMYFENYGLEKHAVQQYARLEEGRRASACAGAAPRASGLPARARRRGAARAERPPAESVARAGRPADDGRAGPGRRPATSGAAARRRRRPLAHEDAVRARPALADARDADGGTVGDGADLLAGPAARAERGIDVRALELGDAAVGRTSVASSNQIAWATSGRTPRRRRRPCPWPRAGSGRGRRTPSRCARGWPSCPPP